MISDAEQMEGYRQRMIFLEQERNEWLNTIQDLKVQNSRMRKAIANLRSANQLIQNLYERYPDVD